MKFNFNNDSREVKFQFRTKSNKLIIIYLIKLRQLIL